MTPFPRMPDPKLAKFRLGCYLAPVVEAAYQAGRTPSRHAILIAEGTTATDHSVQPDAQPPFLRNEGCKS